MDKNSGAVMGILEKWFKDPIDEPCPYCRATEEICQLFDMKGLKKPPVNTVTKWDGEDQVEV